MQKTTFLIPANLDINKLIKDNPEITFLEGFHPNKLCLILHFINLIPSRNKKIREEQDYTQLSSKEILKKYLSNSYPKYIEFLVQTGIIECDGIYVKEEKCYGYRISDSYRGLLKAYEVSDFCLKKKLHQEHHDNKTKLKKLKYLTKWIDKLEIDQEKAKEYNEWLYQIRDRYPEIKEDKKPQIKVARSGKKYMAREKKDHEKQYASVEFHLKDFKNKQLYINRDKSVKRVHSTLTNLQKDFRNLITCDGKQIVSIDIKNSQPYLLLALLQEEFWQEAKKAEKRLFRCNLICNKEHQIFKRSGKIQHIRQEVKYLMFPKSSETPVNTDVLTFQKLVVGGKLYEEMSSIINRDSMVDVSRKELKEAMFTILYSDNNFRGNKFKGEFKKLFPTLFDFLELLKDGRNEALPRILQSIESYLIIDVISKRIANEKPWLPIYTIHDSIATTVGNEAYVKQIMEDELTKYIGHKPSLATEHWKLEYVAKQRESILKKIACTENVHVEHAA
jgi:hypothetical protein